MSVTGSFIESWAGTITSSAQPLEISGYEYNQTITSSAQPLEISGYEYNQITLVSQSLLSSYSVQTTQQFMLTYPVIDGYSGSVPVELTPLPTQSITLSTSPTFGQLWPL